MEKTLDGSASGGAVLMNEVLDYSLASFEYTGLVLLSLIKRGGIVLMGPVERVATPVRDRVGALCHWTSRGFNKSLGSLFRRRGRLQEIDERLREIEKILAGFGGEYITKKDLQMLEERLEYLEKHGIVASQEGGLQLKGKKLTEEKIMFLRAIVRENINLLEE